MTALATNPRALELLRKESEAPAQPREFAARRRVTNSPDREFARRGGATGALPDSVAAMICCYVIRRKVTRNGVAVTVNEEAVAFWSADSPTCQTRLGEFVLVAVNRQLPDRCHVFDERGAYVETIPAKETPAMLHDPEGERRALEDARRAIGRQRRQLARLHRDDAKQAADDARANTPHVGEAIKRVSQIFPHDDTPSRTGAEAAHAQTEGARQIADAERNAAAERQQHRERRIHNARLIGAADADLDDEFGGEETLPTEVGARGIPAESPAKPERAPRPDFTDAIDRIYAEIEAAEQPPGGRSAQAPALAATAADLDGDIE